MVLGLLRLSYGVNRVVPQGAFLLRFDRLTIRPVAQPGARMNRKNRSTRRMGCCDYRHVPIQIGVDPLRRRFLEQCLSRAYLLTVRTVCSFTVYAIC